MVAKKKSSEDLMLSYQSASPLDATEAFEELFYRYRDRVYAYALSKLQNRTDAEDILQKSFQKVHESKHLYNDKFKFEQWIFVITRSAVIDLTRRKKVDLKKIEQILEEQQTSLPVDEDEKNYDLEILNHLSVDQKRLIEMKYAEDLSYNEIAKILNKSEVSLRKMTNRLILKLRNGGA